VTYGTWRYVFACIAYTSNPAKRFLLKLPIVRECIGLRNEQLENHTLSRNTYLYSLYAGEVGKTEKICLPAAHFKKTSGTRDP